MTTKNKDTLKSIMTTWLTPSLILGGMLFGANYVGKMEINNESKQFENPAQKEKTRQHIDSDYNEVRNYQLMEEQKEMKVQLDTSFAFVNALFKEDRARLKLDSINSANAIKSRHARDSLNEKVIFDINNIKRDQTIQANTNQLILQELRYLRKLIDTIK
jgi:hypothetical protein